MRWLAVLVVAGCGRIGFDPTTCAPTTARAFAIATADDATYVQLADGTLAAWGGNASGQLGDGSKATRFAPVAPVGLGAVAMFSAGAGHACAIAGGAIACWGRNHTGELGVGDQLDRTAPVAVALAGPLGISAGGKSTAAWDDAGTLWFWGELDSAPGVTTLQTSVPQAVGGLPAVVDVAASSAEPVLSTSGHVCAAAGTGTAWCFGSNVRGQLGDGTTTSTNTPVQVANLSNVVAVTAGEDHSCARTATGDVWCWGGGQRGDGGDTNVPCASICPASSSCGRAAGRIARAPTPVRCGAGATTRRGRSIRA
jgi:alpha-tubulin suppressor-like RCC1 family protein